MTGRSPNTARESERKRRKQSDRRDDDSVDYHNISRDDSEAGDAPGPSVPNTCVTARLAAMESMIAEMKRAMDVTMPRAAAGTVSSPQGGESDLFDEFPEDYTDDVSYDGLVGDSGSSAHDPLGDFATGMLAGSRRAPVGGIAQHMPPTSQPTSVPGTKARLEEYSLAIMQDVMDREDDGEDVFEGLAKCLDKSLRLQPSSTKVRELCDRYQFPANVPKLKVPAMNVEVLTALPKGGKLLESKLSKSSGLIAKSLVPLFRILTDIHDGSVRPLDAYCEDIFACVRLLVANLNYLHQTRKDVCSVLIQENALKQLCTWQCAIGDEFIFPFDVTKKVEEYKKAKQLGVHKRRFFRGRPGFRGRGRSYGGRGRYNNFRGFPSQSNSQSGRGKAPAGK